MDAHRITDLFQQLFGHRPTFRRANPLAAFHGDVVDATAIFACTKNARVALERIQGIVSEISELFGVGVRPANKL